MNNWNKFNLLSNVFLATYSIEVFTFVNGINLSAYIEC